jgi:hypothetical protein
MSPSLLLVVGSGRSGTSMLSGILQRLGYRVPEPEVPADASNPRGFAESQWVVDFHSRLLAAARVQTTDARPSAWAETAKVSGARMERELRSFLRRQFAESDHVLIKDPRLLWFLPLWRRTSADIGVNPRCLITLRHPSAVVASKSQYYGQMHGDVARAAGWLNTMLYTERATRAEPRAFMRYDDLLDDWTKTVASVGDRLLLEPVTRADAHMIRAADAFVDRSLSRSEASWDGVDIPADLLGQIEQTWTLLDRLADKDASDEQLVEDLDAARAAYIHYYAQAEAVTESTVKAAVRAAEARRSGGLRGLARRIPNRYRRRIPAGIKRIIQSRLSQTND